MRKLPVLLSASRTILLEDPTFIERLPRAAAARIDRLLEANRLEPFVHAAIAREGSEAAVSPARRLAWRNAHLLAAARWSAYEDAWSEVLELCRARRIPLCLAGGAWAALRVYDRPELRPLQDLEVAVPAGREKELRAALRSRRFFQVETLGVPPAAGGRKPPARPPSLERDGVEVRIIRGPLLDSLPCSAIHPLARPLRGRIHPLARPLRGRPEEAGVLDEECTGEADAADPLSLEPEAFAVLHAREMARRGFAHSLLLLNDLRLIFEKLRPRAAAVLALAERNGLAFEVRIALTLLQDLLGTETGCRSHVDGDGAPGRRSPASLLSELALSMVLQHPASARLQALIGRLLEQHKSLPASR